jgi:hypothetical protein
VYKKILRALKITAIIVFSLSVPTMVWLVCQMNHYFLHPPHAPTITSAVILNIPVRGFGDHLIMELAPQDVNDFSILLTNSPYWMDSTIQLRGYAQEDNPDSLKFSSGNLKDASALGAKLRNPTDPFSFYMRSRLRESTRSRLDKWHGPGELPRALRDDLVNDLNFVVKGTCIWSEGRFTNVIVPQETLASIMRDAPGEDIARLNKALLLAAYAAELSTNQAIRIYKKLQKRPSLTEAAEVGDQYSSEIQVILNRKLLFMEFPQPIQSESLRAIYEKTREH